MGRGVRDPLQEPGDQRRVADRLAYVICTKVSYQSASEEKT
jgi:hypothetical protein